MIDDLMRYAKVECDNFLPRIAGVLNLFYLSTPCVPKVVVINNKFENQIKQVFFIFKTLELLWVHRRLKSLNLYGTYPREPRTRPHRCATLGQLTMFLAKKN